MLGRQTLGHDAFLSYGHAADAVLAPVLQAELQRYAKPWYRARALHIFRDDTDLAAEPALMAGIERELAVSSWFILLASPAAARSQWVDREVAWWLKNRSTAHLLVALTDGELPDALPPAFRNADLPEPGWVDLRGLQHTGKVDRADRKLERGVVNIAATIHGIPKANLVGEQVRQRRRTRQWVGGTIAGLSLLLITVLLVSIVASNQSDRASDQQRLAVSRALVSQAETARGRDPRTALLLNETAQHLHPDANTQSSTFQTLVTNRYKGSLGGHTGPVSSVAYSPDRHTVATGSFDGTVILWDVTDPSVPRRGSTLTGHNGGVNAVAFSPDGHTLATGSADKTIIVWTLTDPSLPRRGPTLTGHNGGVNAVAFSPDGHTLATGSADKTIIVWDLTRPAVPRRASTLTGYTNAVSSVAFSPKGHTLATGSADPGTTGTPDQATVLWDLTNPAAPRRGPNLTDQSSFVTSVAFSPDGNTLAACAGNDVVVWDLTNPTAPRNLGERLAGHVDTVTSVAFSPDGRTVASGSEDGTVVLYDLANPTTFSVGRPLNAVTGGVLSVAFSPDGHTLATGNVDQDAVLWDLTEPAVPRRGPTLSNSNGYTGGDQAVAFSPDSHILVTSDQDQTYAVLWDLTDPTAPRRGPTLTGHTNAITSIDFAPDGHTLATGSADRSVILWDLSDPATPRRGPTLPINPNVSVNSVAFSPDAHTLAVGIGDFSSVSIPPTVGPDQATVLWDVTNPKTPRRGPTLTGYSAGVKSVAFSPDGRTLATGSADRTTVLWDVTELAAPRRGPTLTGHTNAVMSVAFSPDGHTLAVGSLDDSTILWDLTDPTTPRQGPTLAIEGRTVYSLTFSPDGRTLETSGGDQTVTVWDLTDSTAPREGPSWKQSDQINQVAFAPNGRTLAAGTTSGTVTLWDPTGPAELRDHAMQRACTITQGGVNPTEWAKYVPSLDYEDSCAPN